MSKQLITVHGEDVVVREDTAKAYRGVNWMMLSVGAFVIITALMLIYFGFDAAVEDTPPPAGTEQR